MVWFDLGRVLLEHRTDFLHREIGKLSLPVIPAYNVYLRLEESYLVTKYDLGQITTDEFFQRLEDLFCISARGALETVWARTLVLSAPMWRLKDTLRRNNFSLGVISDTNESHIERFQKLTGTMLLKTFSTLTFSCRTGFLKTDPRAFLSALELENNRRSHTEQLAPNQCVLIDDREVNIATACRVGFYGVQHTPGFITKTYGELARFGINLSL